MDASWSIEELQEGFLPDDFHHLWTILCKNPEKSVKMTSIKTDLKMIRNILPEEVNQICKEIYKLLNPNQQYENVTYEYNDLYKFMAVNYLKYGLAGIEVRNEKYCINCGEDMKTNQTMFCISDNIKEHNIRCYYNTNFMVITCHYCGLHRKFDASSNENINSFGPCYTKQKKHIFQNCRYLYCPIDDE